MLQVQRSLIVLLNLLSFMLSLVPNQMKYHFEIGGIGLVNQQPPIPSHRERHMACKPKLRQVGCTRKRSDQKGIWDEATFVSDIVIERGQNSFVQLPFTRRRLQICITEHRLIKLKKDI